MKTLLFAMELIGFLGVFLSFSILTWTKLTLGGALSFLGVFFPSRAGDGNENKDNKAAIRLGPIAVDFQGGLRFALVVAGIVLLIGGVNQGGKDSAKAVAKAGHTLPIEDDD
jgi:hypothetical protein